MQVRGSAFVFLPLVLALGAAAAGCGTGGGGSNATSATATTAAGATPAGTTTSSSSTSSTAPSSTSSTTSTPPPAPTPVPTFQVSGWLPSWAYTSGDVTVRANTGDGLDEVNLFGYSLQSDGSIVAASGVESATRQQAIRAAGGELIPTLYDVNSSATLPAVLADPTRRQRTIQAVLDVIDRFGYDGIDIDFEHATSSTRAAFSAFMADMARAVRGRGKVFSLTIPGKRSDTPSWAGYDYVALGAVADRVKLMCYGYSGPWSSTPGPICPTTWITRVMDYAVTTMPASKLMIGIPFYGYDWPASGGTVQAVTWSSAQSRLARSATGLRFDATLGETTFDYTDASGGAHTVWLQDARAIAAKCDMARRYGCRGVSIWALGNEDPAFWDEVRRVLK
jgi:spore germination protein YaaH